MTTIATHSDDSYNFETISEFIFSLKCGGEIEFIWNGKAYSITREYSKFNISEGYYIKDGKNLNAESHEEVKDIYGFTADTPEELLNYCIEDEKLRNIITKAYIKARTL